ncbi:helix-turn-helix domain-containing protein [Streptomyces sp. 6N223]|uniref:helix-turn-helix domain-containing protein n=1 Tax=Streptomyces sp. 6N223 TaxID=3457412 RepID=UPI003FD1A70D
MTFEPKDLDPYLSVRHFYGSRLRRLRERADWGLEVAAAKLNVSKSTLSRLELAETPPQDGFSEIADRVFETGGWFVDLYELLKLEIHPDQYKHRMEWEAKAHTIEEYAGMSVPGLLQTEAYALASFRVGDPRRTKKEIQRLMDGRLGRQARLRSANSPEYSAILDEAAIRRPVGGPAVMRAQLASLIEQVERPNGVVQLIPFAHGEHALTGGLLTLMTIDDGTTVAWEESIDSGTLIEDRERVRARQRAYDRLRSHALSPRETAAFLASVMEELPDEHHP